MVNQFLSETMAVVLQGYYYKRTTGDSGGGALLGDFKTESAGIGLVMMWATKVGGKDLALSAKWMHTVNAKNRFVGNNFYVNGSRAF